MFCYLIIRLVSLNGPSLDKINDLNLSHNNLSSMGPGLFNSSLVSSVEILDLSHNKIDLSSSLVLSVFLNTVLHSSKTLSQLCLTGNVGYDRTTLVSSEVESSSDLKTTLNIFEFLPNLEYLDDLKVSHNCIETNILSEDENDDEDDVDEINIDNDGNS